MTDVHDAFLEDDDILASVLEENDKNINSIVDLCVSPKKRATVQSRLSHFFRKPAIDNVCHTDTNSGAGKQSDQIYGDINYVCDNEESSSLSSIFYKEPDANGFHLLSGSHYVYPSNFPVRKYQMETIKTALFHNTLVSLPTGMGKTFIAAVVMYNFYRWYPTGKIIFMAPTRPLVAQQIEACITIMGIPKETTIEMTGNIPPEQRYLAWKKYRVFFLTPQVLANDLNLNKCPSEMFRCLVVDEAHRATKDYAYVQVLKRLQEENRVIRIIGLTATPGSTTDSVIEVIQNLSISKLEFRTDESLDVAKYTNKKQVECLPVKLSHTILNIRTQFLEVYDKYSRRLKHYRALNGNVTNLTKFQIFNAKQKFMASNLCREMPNQIVGCLVNDFTVCMSLAYALELLTVYGIKAFYLQSLDLLENHKCLSNDADLQKMLQNINKELNSQDLTWSHPKLFELKRIVLDYFCNENTESNSKIIIFCQYRLVVLEVFELLKTFGSTVKPVMFVGQSLKKKGGLPQKKQLEVMSRFKSGYFNILIATSVAEEGLDIGEVDLIICLEANKSPIKFVQRLGRTGRRRSGKCITLLTENIEESKYKSSVSSSKTLVLKMLKNNAIISKLASGGPRLVPKHITPQCLMIYVKQPDNILPDKKKINTKPSMKSTINQNYEYDEEGLDIFEDTKDKPRKKTKKQKTTVASKKVKSHTEKDMDLNFDHHSVNNDFSLSENNLLAMTDRDFNSRINNDLDHFIDEENAFNEWLQSCEQANSISMNRPFFKLLNLFTKPCSIVNYELINKPLNLYTADGELNKMSVNKADVDDFLEKIDNNCLKEMTINVNKESQRYIESSSLSNHDNIQQRPLIINKIDSVTEHFFDVSVEKNYSENLVKSQNSDIHINKRYDKEITAELFDLNKPIIKLNNELQKSPVICSGRSKLDTIEPKETLYTKKIDFNEMFKSQRTDKHIHGCTGKDTNSRDRQLSNNQIKLQSLDITIDPIMNFESDDSTRMLKTVKCDDNDNDESEYDEAMGNINFEKLFKSQRVDAVIEKYNDTIFVGEQYNDDSNDSNEIINVLQKSSIICSEWQKSQTANCKSDDRFLGKTDQSIIQIIDLVDSDKENGEGIARADRECLLKSQKRDIEDYMQNNEVRKTVVSGGEGGQDIIPVIDDDVISISDSPEFFSCKLPTKIIQTKLSDCFHPTAEIINLLSPPLCKLDCIIDQSTEKDRLSNKNVNSEDKSVLWNDEDDMDFLFVDYCSGAGSSNIPFSPKNKESSGICNEVFTQKQWVGNIGTNDVITQKERVDSDDGSTTVITQLPQSSIINTLSSPMPLPTENNKIMSMTTVKHPQKVDNEVKSMIPLQSYNNSLLSFNFMKTCNLLKPGFSLKRNIAPAVKRTTNDMSPINSSDWRNNSLKFSQSTPKIPTTTVQIKTKQQREPIEKVNVFLTSSSDSDVFIKEKKNCHRIKKKRRPKPKKKLLFIDDEADVSNCGNTTAATTINNSSSSEDDDDNNVDFDSSFIDDDSEKSIPSTSMTNQYLQSVKSSAYARGIFKIPVLSTQHYNMDVYSQMDDRNDNSYEEDSFCVRDTSDLNISSNTSVQRTPENQPPKQRKRKRIKSPLHSTDSDSDDDRTMLWKRAKAPRLLDLS